MKFTASSLAGAVIIEPDKRVDNRGYFARVFCAREFAAAGLPANFVQTSVSLSRKQHTLRGMHYQLPPHAEAKLVRCITGSLLDVIIDLRPDSPTFKQHYAVELSAANGRTLLVPKQFAHGFLTLTVDTEILYMMDEFHTPRSERGIRWDDPQFSISWPFPPRAISGRDAGFPDFDPALHLPADASA